jgi:hypothetical protein
MRTEQEEKLPQHSTEAMRLEWKTAFQHHHTHNIRALLLAHAHWRRSSSLIRLACQLPNIPSYSLIERKSAVVLTACISYKNFAS